MKMTFSSEIISNIGIDLEQGFPLLLLVVRVQLDVEFLDQLLCLLFLEVHDGIKYLNDDNENLMIFKTRP